MTSLILRIIAPYLAVLVFWVWLQNGWLAILAYHAQIVYWACKEKKIPHLLGSLKQTWWITLPTIFTVVITYFLLPHIIEPEVLKEWFSAYKLTGTALLIMVPYFGIFHPVLEEMHWRRITNETQWGHLFFGAYHGMVLISLCALPLVLVAVLGLIGVSFLWSYLYKKEGSLLSPILFHIFADLGMITAAVLLIR